MTTELPATPTLTIPAPSKESDPAAITPDDASLVVFPTAKTDRRGFVAAVDADIIILPAEKPTLAMPAPSNERVRASRV
jgi:hypothetical protein